MWIERGIKPVTGPSEMKEYTKLLMQRQRMSRYHKKASLQSGVGPQVSVNLCSSCCCGNSALVSSRMAPTPSQMIATMQGGAALTEHGIQTTKIPSCRKSNLRSSLLKASCGATHMVQSY